MHHHFIIGLLKIVCLTLGAEVTRNQRESGVERSASEGVHNGHLRTLRQFLNPQETGLEWLNLLHQLLNNLESRMGTVEGEMTTVKGEMTTVKGEMNTVKGKVEILDQSRCITGEFSGGYNNWLGDWIKVTHTVTFGSPFPQVPKVIVSPMKYDMEKRANHYGRENPRWQNLIESVDEEGFRLSTRTFCAEGGAWMFYDLEFSWMACG